MSISILTFCLQADNQLRNFNPQLSLDERGSIVFPISRITEF